MESGAGLCVIRDGFEIELLNGGFCDGAGERAWTNDTLVLVWSATKGLAAACALHAMQEAGANLGTVVADFWPEFGYAGKSKLTLSHVLSHRAGLCVLDDPAANILDHCSVVRAIEMQRPVLPPEAGPAYGPRVFGFVLDEIVRRLTGGESLGAYWRRVFAEPLDLDCWIGLPEALHNRVATILPPRGVKSQPHDEAFAKAFADSESLTRRAFTSLAGISGISAMNAPQIRSASIPSMGGIASARALAKFYAMLAQGGISGGTTFFSTQTLQWMSSPLVQSFDPVLQREMAFSAGFMLDPLDSCGRKIRSLLGPSESAFGHAGAGGSLGFADPSQRMGFAYVMNRMEPGVMPGSRCQNLVEAVFGEN